MNNPLCSKINHFLQLRTQPGSWKKSNSIYYEFDSFFGKKSNNGKNSSLPIRMAGGQRGLMGGNQCCGWVLKVAPSVHLKLVGKRKSCWAPLPQKKLRPTKLNVWLHWWVASAKYDCPFPDNCGLFHISALKIMRKILIWLLCPANLKN